MIRCVLFFISAAVVVISRQKPPVPILSEPITQTCSMWAAIVLFLFILFWLPFRRDEKLTAELENLKKASGQGLIILSAKYGDGAIQEDVTPKAWSAEFVGKFLWFGEPS
jgi:hypothetical protein